MVNAMHRKIRLGLLLLGGLLAMCLGLLTGPASAKAEVTTYCGGWLSAGNSVCQGAPRWLYEVYGWGEQGAVCVQVGNISVMACAKHANQGVYSGTGLGYNSWAAPFIINYSSVNNFVHGLAGTY